MAVWPNLSASARLAGLYKRLASTSEALNRASDALAVPIQHFELILELLNIGLDTWQKTTGGEGDFGGWCREVGYIKLYNGSWGLAIQSREWHEAWEDEHSERWAFNEAPQSFRIEALDKLPELFEELIKNAEKTTKKLQEKTEEEAQQLARVLQLTADELKKQKDSARQQKPQEKLR